MRSYDLLRFVHVLSVVFMAAPLYNLIVVNERVRFGKAHLQVDQYFEAIIRGNSTRCYVFQLTALGSGIALTISADSVSALFTNRVLLAKEVLLLALIGLLSVVHFSIQPRIDKLLRQATGDTLAPSIAAEIAPLRLKRKRLAAVCLFLVMTTVLLGLQVFAAFGLATTGVLVLGAAVFAWKVYKTPVRYGWM